ncbi:hypothetical protein CgS9114_05602, partial [Corynebacterium glutamicum S9114]
DLRSGGKDDFSVACRSITPRFSPGGQKLGPELDKHTRWYRQVPDWQASSWRVDETYIRVGGRWCYL